MGRNCEQIIMNINAFLSVEYSIEYIEYIEYIQYIEWE